MDVDVRPATRDDIGGIVRIAERSWEHDYPDILSRETAAEGVHEWYSEGRLASELRGEDARIFVAEDGDGVMGFVHTARTDGEGDVLRLYVDPGHRGEGIGSALLDRAVEYLFDRGAERVRAMVLAANEPGHEFYRTQGFERAPETEETEIAGDRYEEHAYVLER